MSEHPFDMLPKGTNPFWSVWLASTDLRNAPDYEYLAWVRREWADFDKRHGFNERQRVQNRARFKVELAEKYAAQIAAKYRPAAPDPSLTHQRKGTEG